MTEETQERFDHIDDVYDRLAQSARRREVQKNLLDPKSDQDLGQAREFVNNTILDGVVTQAELCRRTGIKPTAVSTFRNNCWKGKLGTQFTVAKELCTAIDQLLTERRAAETSVSGYVSTRMAEQGMNTIRYAVKRKYLAALMAPNGAGKSMLLQAARDSFAGAVLMIVDGDQASPIAFLRVWAGALGLSTDGRRSDLRNRIVNCLIQSGRLILIDEADQLPPPTLNTIRQIWDEAQIPIVLAGAPTLKQTLTTRRIGTESAELMARLYRRVKICTDLTIMENPETGEREPLFTVADIKKVFARGNVRFAPEALDMLCKLANRPHGGGLGYCATLVQYARDFYPDELITPSLIRRIMPMAIGATDAEFIANQAGIDIGPARVAVG